MTRNSRKLEVIMLSFLVLLPFILMLILGFALFTFPGANVKDEVCNLWEDEDDEKENYRRVEPYCDDSNIMALVQKIYPDDDSFNVRFRCTGLIIGMRIGAFLVDCFRNEYDKVPIKSLHYVTSGSRYWSKDRNIHRIIKWRILNPRGDAATNSSLIIIEVDPEFPQPCDEKQDTFFVEERYDPKVEHKLIGWSAASKTAHVEFMQVPFNGACTEYAPSAVVFSQYGSTSGFQSTTCTERSAFDDTLVPLSMFIEKLATEFANIDITRIERSKRNVNGTKFQMNTNYTSDCPMVFGD
ncbi:uncharacterized protein LOC130896321 [Diorhabda carinulata]|uniref:uncharacterized protein LOC130896321 n=1 Tax=Diorhabda carinulata TaxID=1163345 RepID=UPI0025A1537B|nr:uncharacterized protein LOC130896321 [Diorhabda carinulata]